MSSIINAMHRLSGLYLSYSSIYRISVQDALYLKLVGK